MDILLTTLLSTPWWFQYAFVFMFGMIIGSFLDVFVTRFHTGTSLNGRSRCLSCGQTLVWHELIPGLSYVLLHGRCRSCRSLIPKRLLLAEIVTGAVFVLVYSQMVPLSTLWLSLILISALLVISWYDLAHMIIPNEMTLFVTVVSCVIWLQQLQFSVTLPDVLWATVAAVGSFGFFAGLWWYSKGQWIGFGDAKLAVPLGFILGPAAAASFIVFSFWIGAVVSLFIIAIQWLLKRGQPHLPFLKTPITMKSEIPFAPFMIASFVLVYLYNANVLSFMESIIYVP